ncbi:MAG: hypothetical protein KGJ13_07195 [Patescibacteria group bacterium]|nr:hypothetical protein [Patescibacteria group bacterium]
MTNRAEAIQLMARQIAIFNGHVWAKLPQVQIDRYMTLATNLLATVERKQSAYNWNFRQ